MLRPVQRLRLPSTMFLHRARTSAAPSQRLSLAHPSLAELAAEVQCCEATEMLQQQRSVPQHPAGLTWPGCSQRHLCKDLRAALFR